MTDNVQPASTVDEQTQKKRREAVRKWCDANQKLMHYQAEVYFTFLEVLSAYDMDPYDAPDPGR